MRTKWLAALTASLLAVGGMRAGAVEVTDFAIYSQGNVKVKGTIEGDVGSAGGDVKLQGDTLVGGDVIAAGQVKASRGVVVQGTITPLMLPVKGLSTAGASGLPTLPSGVGSFSAGGPSYKGKYDELELDPGDYGSLKVKGAKEGGSLFLSSGEYHFDQLSLKNMDVKFDVSKGAVTLFVSGKMGVGSGVNVFVATSDGDFLSLEEAGSDLAGLVYAEAGSMVKISGSEWAGTLYTPDGKLVVKKSTIDGALYSNRGVTFGSSSLDYVPLDLSAATVWPPAEGSEGQPDDYNPPGMVAPAPEPSTLALLGSLLGGLLINAWRRKGAGRSRVQ